MPVAACRRHVVKRRRGGDSPSRCAAGTFAYINATAVAHLFVPYTTVASSQRRAAKPPPRGSQERRDHLKLADETHSGAAAVRTLQDAADSAGDGADIGSDPHEQRESTHDHADMQERDQESPALDEAASDASGPHVIEAFAGHRHAPDSPAPLPDALDHSDSSVQLVAGSMASVSTPDDHKHWSRTHSSGHAETTFIARNDGDVPDDSAQSRHAEGTQCEAPATFVAAAVPSTMLGCSASDEEVLTVTPAAAQPHRHVARLAPPGGAANSSPSSATGPADTQQDDAAAGRQVTKPQVATGSGSSPALVAALANDGHTGGATSEVSDDASVALPQQPSKQHFTADAHARPTAAAVERHTDEVQAHASTEVDSTSEESSTAKVPRSSSQLTQAEFGPESEPRASPAQSAGASHANARGSGRPEPTKHSANARLDGHPRHGADSALTGARGAADARGAAEQQAATRSDGVRTVSAAPSGSASLPGGGEREEL